MTEPDDWVRYIEATHERDPDAEPVVHECLSGCGWWEPSLGNDWSAVTCPRCGEIAPARRLLSKRQSVKAKARAAGVPLGIAEAMTLPND